MEDPLPEALFSLRLVTFPKQTCSYILNFHANTKRCSKTTTSGDLNARFEKIDFKDI